ncbi:MAG TPA: DNA polymerase IV [Planctomycetaceae bacterium]|nr:DNA polymerase IV [Planctomycetaceae bacterium]
MILHVDMDAFYASVEERERPELRGQPIIVGGTPERRGVVAAANYLARKNGVHSAMPASRAKQLCPQAVFLPSRLDHYAKVSRQIRDIFHRYTPLVEPLSLDEAFLDVTGSEKLFGSPVEIGRQIKQAIFEELQLVASVGIASTKFVAKVASDLEKPDGFVIVESGQDQQFLDPLPVGRIWGVGRVTGQVFERLGVRTIRDLRGLPQETLRQQFGDHGRHLWELAHGIDDRRVTPDREAKSISHETTFSEDIEDPDALRAWILELTEQVVRRLRRHKLLGRTVHLKVRFSDFRTITRSITLPRSTNVTQDIWKAAEELFSNRLPAQHQPVRLLGVGISGLDNPEQIQRSLFGDEDHAAQTNLDHAADQIRDKFGSTSIGRASGLLHSAKHVPKPDSGDPVPGMADLKSDKDLDRPSDDLR